jgi:general secretion pathway protein C
MERYWPRYLWVADLTAIVVGGAFAGHAAAVLVGAGLLGGLAPPAPLAHAEIASPAPARASEESIDAIVGRNLFCSGCDAPQAPAVERGRRALTLLAIMYAPSPAAARWSVAIVRDDETATTGPYGVGARMGDATIVAIEDVRVVLEVGGGRRELLELLPPSPRPAPEPRGPVALRWSAGVRKTGAHSYEVQRAALEQVLAGGAARPFPRVVPQMRDGEAIGLRLFGIRRDGPFGVIGLSDGDLLLEVNGRSIASPDSALAAYAALRSASHVSLLLERGGQRLRMDYVVR